MLDAGAVIGRQERHWAMAAHLSGLLWLLGGTSLFYRPFGAFSMLAMLAPLIIWRGKKDSLPFASAQAKESLNFQITVWLLGLLFVVLAFVLIGFLFLWLLGIAVLALVIIATLQVSDGKPYRYPFCLRLIA